jgi:hypothetical protein
VCTIGRRLMVLRISILTMKPSGGTEERHMVSVARSKEPYGPWEGCPQNPLIQHYGLSAEEQPIRCTGKIYIDVEKWNKITYNTDTFFQKVMEICSKIIWVTGGLCFWEPDVIQIRMIT